MKKSNNPRSKVISLDLSKVILYASENHFLPPIIDSILKGIRANDIFEPLAVFKVNNKEYELVSDGKHRAIAHYRERRPLKVKLVNSKRRNYLFSRGDFWTRIRIEDIVAYHDSEYSRRIFEEKRSEDPKYR